MLSIQISRENDKSICIDQVHYIQDVLEEFGMQNCRGAKSPLPVGDDPESSLLASECDEAQYRKAIGCLLYLANGTRPDIAYAVGRMATFCDKPTKYHWNRVMHI